MGENGCVAWMFHKKGYVAVEKSKSDEDTLLNIVLDAGAEDMKESEGTFEIYTAPESYEAVVEALKKNHIEIASSEISMVPQSYTKLEGKLAQQMIKLMEALDDHEDVQKVHANFEISEAELEAAAS